MPEYETLNDASPRSIRRTDAGPEPAPDVFDLNQWEPGEDVDADAQVRDELAAYRRGGDAAMMTEIDDGVFVQWGRCSQCNRRISACGCSGGPVEPAHIARWREDRMLKDAALPADLAQLDRKVLLGKIRAGEVGDNAAEAGEWTTPGERREVAEWDEALAEDPNRTEYDPDTGTYQASDTRQNVDDGLSASLEAVKQAAEEEDTHE